MTTFEFLIALFPFSADLNFKFQNYYYYYLTFTIHYMFFLIKFENYGRKNKSEMKVLRIIKKLKFK